VSSTGGQIMPPVMGAAAFIMAEYLKVPYATIMTAALLPALLFYGATACQLDFMARKMGLPAYDGEADQPLSALALEGLLLLMAFVLLLGGIFWGNLPTELAAVIATGALALAGLSLLGRRGFSLGRLVSEVAETGLSSAEVLLVCGLAGLIVALLTTTGLGFTLSLILLEIGRYSLFLLLVVTAAVSLILGMGMPTTAVYMLLATLAAPSLVQLGVQPLAAHMFVFYYGLLSMITPPVALAAFAAASLASASPMQVSWHCIRLGWVAFLVPFLFIYQPAVLMQGPALSIGLAVMGYLAAVPLVTGALVGHALSPLGLAERLLWAAVGGVILSPFETLGGAGLWIELAAITLGGTILILHARARETTA
jgi:TRAP transporter 4TM/12TM fusion protein